MQSIYHLTVTDHGYIIIVQTGLKKVSKFVLKHKSFNAMLDFLFSGGFLYDTCNYLWQIQWCIDAKLVVFYSSLYYY